MEFQFRLLIQDMVYKVNRMTTLFKNSVRWEETKFDDDSI
jgi:hypothetical protein